MNPATPSDRDLTNEVADLRARLTEATDVLSAIRNGEVDAVLVHGPQGDRFFTLKGADEPYRVLIEEMNQGALTLSADGSVLYCNRRFADLLKTTPEKIVGLAFSAFVSLAERAKFSTLLEASRSGAIAREITLSAADGSAAPMQLALGPLPVDSAAAISLVATDISESREKENRLHRTMAALLKAEEAAEAARTEAERANVAKSEFLSRMSHELRTPMNAILGFGQLLEREGREPVEADNIDQVMKAGRHLLTLINEALDISGIEAGRLALSIEPVHVGEVIGEMLSLVRTAAEARGITLGELVCDRLVNADRQRLKQVLLNLLTNAIKYNREGGRVAVTALATARGSLRLTVHDTGPGITLEDAAKIFDPFERLGAAESQIEGTGLGLAISKRLVEVMGGRIGLESANDAGSAFWIELPLIETGCESDAETEEPAAEIRYQQPEISNCRTLLDSAATSSIAL